MLAPPPTGPLEITVTLGSFPGAYAAITRATTLHTTWAELVWAAITVGRWRDDLFLYGKYSWYEALGRAHTLYAHVASEGGSDRLTRSKLYDSLDRSEKSGVSYLLGMTTAKLWAEVVLGVPYLMHLDRYSTRHSIVLRGSRRPDLFAPIGLSDWLVIEAKGRTNGLTRDVVKLVSAQKNGVASISGRPPVLSVGTVAHFEQGHLELFCTDPPPEGEASIDLDTEGFVRAYYEPLWALLEEGAERVEDHDLSLPAAEAVYLREMDFWVGLTREIVERLRMEGHLAELVPPWRPEPAARFSVGPPSSEVASVNSVAIGADGVVVVLGPTWASDIRSVEH